MGDICSFGEYKQINNNENKQPIEWRVFKVDGTKGAFLISEYVLETKPYNKTKIDVSWETCTLRSWLNGLGPENNTDGVDYSESNFIDTAFSTTEKSYINNITHTNSYNGNSVEDKVFLLDYAEISVYKLGVKYGTSYYCNANTMIDVTVCRWDEAHDFQFPVGWWIRSQKNDMNYATTVSVRGNTGTYSVNAGKLGVLPALWFKK